MGFLFQLLFNIRVVTLKCFYKGGDMSIAYYTDSVHISICSLYLHVDMVTI